MNRNKSWMRALAFTVALALILQLAPAGLGAPVHAATDPADIIAHYEFEGNTDNTSSFGSIYNATIEGGSVSYVDGFLGQAVKFDGSGGYVKLPNDILRNNPNFTVIMYFKTTGSGVLLGYQNTQIPASPSQYMPIAYINNVTGKLVSSLWIGGDLTVISPERVDNGVWHKLAVSASSSSISLYLDDLPIGTNNSGSVQHLSMSYNQLGKGFGTGRNLTTDNYGWASYTGLIDDVYILSKGLSSDDIQTMTGPVNNPTITFDTQVSGVTASPSTISVTSGAAYGTLPAPTRAGFAFGGWYAGTDGDGTEITSGSIFNSPRGHTLYAKWIDDQAPTTGAGVTVDAITSASRVISYGEATDNFSTNSALRYKVVYSTASSIDTTSDALQAPYQLDWAPYQLRYGYAPYRSAWLYYNHAISGLLPMQGDEQYWFNVLVQDEAGNLSLYQSAASTAGIAYAGMTSSDTTPPAVTAGATAAVATSGAALEQQISIQWPRVYDIGTTPDAVEYMIVYSTNANLGTIPDALRYGTKLNFHIGNNQFTEWTTFPAATLTPAATITGLQPGTQYHFNVIAKDSDGNAMIYQKTSATTARVNTGPTAALASVNGSLRIGSTLTGTYEYRDADQDAQGTSTYQWYRTEYANGISQTAIANATTTSYTLTSEDVGKYIVFSVTPVALTGVIDGPRSSSGLAGPVAALGGRSSGGGSNAVTTQSGMNQTVVKIDDKTFQNELDQRSKGSYYNIPIPSANSSQVQMNLEMVKQLSQKDVTLTVNNGQVKYQLPPNAINVPNLLANFDKGADASKIAFDIEISNASNEVQKTAQSAAVKDGFAILAPPVTFTMTAAYNGRTVAVNQFGKHVSREIALPAGIDPKRITTAIVIQEDGTTYHVPTYVYQTNGQYFARINSLTNSVYSLIYHTAAFTDTAGAWFETPVLEAASRTILNGYEDGTFQGTNSITRAEFATMLINTLGLNKVGTSSYADVKESDWYYKAVSRANEYQLIMGRPDGNFDPESKITRQEAMIMMQRAAELCGLIADSKDLVANYPDSSKVSEWAKDAVNFNLNSGLITGNNGELKATENITRAEAAVVTLRLLQKSDLIDIRSAI